MLSLLVLCPVSLFIIYATLHFIVFYLFCIVLSLIVTVTVIAITITVYTMIKPHYPIHSNIN